MGEHGGLVAALVFNANLTVEAVKRAVASLDSTANLVVVDRNHRPPRYMSLQVGTVRRALDRAAPDSNIRQALRLDDLVPAPTVDVLVTQNGWADARAGTVVTEGRQVLGVVIASGVTRGMPVGPAPSSPATPTAVPVAPPDRDSVGADSNGGLSGGASDTSVDGGYAPASTAPASTPASPSPAAPTAPPSAAEPRRDAESLEVPEPGLDPSVGSTLATGTAGARFRAFPTATGPNQARAGDPFVVTVGFSARPTEPAAGSVPIIRPNAPVDMTFEVQADGFGFRFPHGVRSTLAVDRDNPGAAHVPFLVIADDVPAPIDRSVEVTFSIDGGVVGMAWCDLTVFPALPTAAEPAPAALTEPLPPAQAPGVTATTSTGGGTAIGVAGEPADLTVTILTAQDSPDVHWLFQSPHAVPLPEHQVTSTLPAANAQAFAEQLMAQLPALKGSPMLDNAVRGMGRDVSGAYPVEFWQLLAEVWAHVQKEISTRVPTLMLITSEPYLPWELAWIDRDRHVPAMLLASSDSDLHQQLGALWSVGRWITPSAQPIGPARPVTPPDSTINDATMAVVIGDYQDPGIEKLVHAVDEGNTLTLDYQAVAIGIDEAAVLSLMDDELTRDDEPFRPAIVHMAAHGKVGHAAQQYTGIVLANKRILDPWVIKGSKLGQQSRPFVFLNACQVGSASSVLNTYGGLAAAFLVSGCRAFLAPLWNVDDDIARDLCLTFYKLVLDEGVPVGEAVRQMRASFLAQPEAYASATPLAYAYYGHPNLHIRRPEES